MDRFALTDTNALYGFVFYARSAPRPGSRRSRAPRSSRPRRERPREHKRQRERHSPRARHPPRTPGVKAIALYAAFLTARHLDPAFTLATLARAHAKGSSSSRRTAPF